MAKHLFKADLLKILLCCVLIFLTALTARFLTKQDTKLENRKVQDVIVKEYRDQAVFIREDGVLSLFDEKARASDVRFMLHPPGYAIWQAAGFSVFGESDDTVQNLSIVVDALSAVIIFLIVLEILPFGVALAAGLFAAFSPQFAVNSTLMLPDTLSVFPLLIAVYFFVKAYKKPTLWKVFLSGVFIGLSCWLRANMLLFAPFLAMASIFILPSAINESKYTNWRWWRERLILVTVLIAGTVITIAPVTVRNAIVFNEFIPLSLGAGQTLLEGIGDYDKDGRTGFPKYDWDVTRQEAEMYNRPDYANNLIIVDGIKRDRMRLQRGWNFIKENPVWFVSIMFRRALWMVTPEKTQIVSTETPVISDSAKIETLAPAWTNLPAELKQGSSLLSNDANISLSTDEQYLQLQSDKVKYGAQFSSGNIAVQPYTESVLRLTLNLREGRIRIKITGAASETVYTSTVVETNPVLKTEEQPLRKVDIPFVSREEAVKFVVNNETPAVGYSTLEIHRAEMFSLGEASFVWARPARFLISGVQRIFSLPVLLPLELIGLGLLIWCRNWKVLAILLVVPFYYFCVQSALHTEYRYILAIHYFLFALAAIAVVQIIRSLLDRLKQRT